ncbi:ABC transporter ATP-binding protein [Pseudomonas sp. LPH1]|nr:ABC transporter ATP-binding protein [Pseudomonas sp. LPH1]AQZ36266.1 ABC transporter ATP-binding protein [Pseudomonas sp. LPH1]
MLENNNEEQLIQLQRIGKHYRLADTALPVLQDVNLLIKRGDSCALIGRSGSGKSTLLNVLGLLDRPDTGSYRLNGIDVAQASADDLAALRNRLIGFVFQSFNLLPRLSALDNVALPLTYRGIAPKLAREQAHAMLEQVGLAERSKHRPASLSGGQRQRVAIARALIGDPALILADEPTGNLDAATAQDIMKLLIELNLRQGVTLVVVTHDPGIASRLGRQIEVRQGRLHESNGQ